MMRTLEQFVKTNCSALKNPLAFPKLEIGDYRLQQFTSVNCLELKILIIELLFRPEFLPLEI
jgi:hypothetical protein